MFKSRSGPRALVALAGTVAIVVAACSGSTATPAPSAAPSQAAVVSAAPSAAPEPTPLLTAAPVDAERARPERRPDHPLVRRPGRGCSAAADRGADGLRHQVQQRPREQGQGVHLARDLRQQGRGQHPQDADRRRQRAGHHRPGRRRGPQPVHRPAGRPAAAHRLDRLRHEQVPGPRWPTSSRSARAGRRSACRSGPTRRSSGTTRSCSTRPSSRTRRPRSATCTRASRGTWHAVRDLGMKLTVDKNGNDATSPDFDPDERRPVGLRHAVRRQQPRRPRQTLFGAGIAARRRRQDGPDPGRHAHRPTNGSTTASGRTISSPPRTQILSDLLGKGSEFAVGQPRDERGPHLVRVLREPGGPGQADRR